MESGSPEMYGVRDVATGGKRKDMEILEEIRRFGVTGRDTELDA